MFVWDPWLTPIPKHLPTPLERILFLKNKINNEDTIQIKGPIIPESKSKRETWTFYLVLEDYRKLFPETIPSFEIISLKKVKQKLESRGEWPTLKIQSIQSPIWNPNKKSWENPNYSAKIGYIVAHKPYRGKDMVKWAFQILYWLGVRTTTLYDASHIDCDGSPNEEINLGLVRTSTKGKTFYESLGFTLGPENPSVKIADPTFQMHQIWNKLTKEVSWKLLQKTWIDGFKLIQNFQKASIKGNDLPTISVLYWNDTKKYINTIQSWNEFINYWHSWGYALAQLYKEYPKTSSPFQIYSSLKEIPTDDCGFLYNWLIILYQMNYKPIYQSTPIQIHSKQNNIIIPGAIDAYKWYLLRKSYIYTDWVAPVVPQPL